VKKLEGMKPAFGVYVIFNVQNFFIGIRYKL